MAFWNRKARNTATTQVSNKPEWIDWNVPQWIEHLPAGEKMRVQTMTKDEQTKEFLDWYAKKSLERPVDENAKDFKPGNPTGSRTDVGVSYGAKVAEYRMTTPGGGGMHIGATPGGVGGIVGPGRGGPVGPVGGPPGGPGGPGPR